MGIESGVLRFTVSGRPQGKARPRASSRGGSVRMYNPPASAAYQRSVAAAATAALMAGDSQWDAAAAIPYLPAGTPVRLVVLVAFATKDKRREGSPCQMKPDLDNTLKAVMDGLTGVLYPDDASVVLIEAVKIYAAESRVDVLAAWGPQEV